jgi:autotransporter-associated beta strand protein
MKTLRFCKSLSCVLSLPLFTTGALGATWYWDSDPGTTGVQTGSGTWKDGETNWWDGNTTVPWSNLAGHIAQFGSSGGAGATGSTPDERTITVDGTVNAAGLVFTSRTSGNSFILNGGKVVLADGSDINVVAGTSNGADFRHRISSEISGSDINIKRTNNSGNFLSLIELRGANSWTGTLTLSSTSNGLFVDVNNAAALNSLTSVSVETNASLVLNTSTPFTKNFTITGNGAGGRGAIRFDASGSISNAGSVTLAGDSTISAVGGVTGTIAGTISGAYQLSANPNNTGTVFLSGNNSFSGGLWIKGGTVTGNTNANAFGTGSVTLGDTTSPTVSARMNVNLANTNVVKNAIVLSAGVTADLTISSPNTGSQATLTGGITGANNILLTHTASAATGGIRFHTGSLNNTGTITNVGTGGGNITIDSVIGANVTGVIQNSSTSPMTLGGSNVFSGGVTVSQGTLNINNAAALGTGHFTITTGTINNSSAGAITLSTNNTQTWNGDFTFAGTRNLNLGTGAVSLGNTPGTRTVNVAAGILTVGGAISDGAATGLTKDGSGTMVLSGISGYTGQTTVAAGTLNVTGQLNGGGSLTVASGATFNLNELGTFVFNIGENGVNNRITGAGAVNLNGNFNFNLSLASLAEGNEWHVVDTSGSTSWSGLNVQSTSGAFSNDAGVWTLVDGDKIWTFSQSTGFLSLSVPEPGATVLLVAGLSGFLVRRRRRMAA